MMIKKQKLNALNTIHLFRWNRFGLFMLMVALASCVDGFNTTESGLKYKFFNQSNGRKAADGEYLIFDMVVTTPGDSIIYSSSTAGMPFSIRYDSYLEKVVQQGALEEGLFMMHIDDSAVFLVEEALLPQSIPMVAPGSSGTQLLCYAKLTNILDYDQYRQWKSDLLAKRKAANEEWKKGIIEAESKKIDSMLVAKRIPYAISSSGIRYVIEKQGNGPHPQKGDSVSFLYAVTYLDGIDLPNDVGKSGTSPRKFQIGSEKVFQSWQESIMLLKEGGRGKFYIPSPLTFGSSESFGIAPNSVLIVDIQLEDIKRK